MTTSASKTLADETYEAREIARTNFLMSVDQMCEYESHIEAFCAYATNVEPSAGGSPGRTSPREGNCRTPTTLTPVQTTEIR